MRIQLTGLEKTFGSRSAVKSSLEKIGFVGDLYEPSDVPAWFPGNREGDSGTYFGVGHYQGEPMQKPWPEQVQALWMLEGA